MPIKGLRFIAGRGLKRKLLIKKQKTGYQYGSPVMDESQVMSMPAPLSECPAAIRDYADGFKDLRPCVMPGLLAQPWPNIRPG